MAGRVFCTKATHNGEFVFTYFSKLIKEFKFRLLSVCNNYYNPSNEYKFCSYYCSKMSLFYVTISVYYFLLNRLSYSNRLAQRLVCTRVIRDRLSCLESPISQ